MRKLKLQMQMSVDGFVCGPNGELDWMVWNWDDQLKEFANEFTASIDTIVMGRKMAPGFINYWAAEAKNEGSDQVAFAKKMTDTLKVVFTKTLERSEWEHNTEIAKGNLADEINNLKNRPGNDIVVYGGAEFVTNLVQEDLIDDLYIYINPVAIGNGLSIFKARKDMKLVGATAYECGIVVHHYQPVK
ncbi:MAG: hypothetical protein JWQ38_3222 [Flavipsychrobacter sp.]|nr:hypothetical protein [Flavipsychrobacter sp.]